VTSPRIELGSKV